jgi:hypothetical protein
LHPSANESNSNGSKNKQRMEKITQ